MNIPQQVKQASYFARHKEADITVESISHDDTGYDTKHKRNLSQAMPNVEPDTIERGGITLEQIGASNVPVCYYKTQITVHGQFEPIRGGYCAATGYKSIVQNGNESIGIRWIAVDGDKKKLVKDCSYMAETRLWHYHANSMETSLTLCKPLNKLAELVEIGKAIPRNTFIGSVSILRAPLYGLAWLTVDIAAIPQAALWQFIGHFTGICSQADYDTRKQAAQAEAQAEDERRKAERDKQNEARKQARQVFNYKMEAEHGLKAVAPEAGKHYVRICKEYLSGKVVYKHVLVSKCFGRFTMKAKTFDTIDEAKQARANEEAISGKGKEITGQTFFQ